MRVFTHQCEKHMAVAKRNTIQIINSFDLRVVDVIQTTHTAARIHCFDIAEVSKDIVSYSTLTINGEVTQHLVVHGLEDTSYLNGVDRIITEKLGRYKSGYNNPMQQAQQVLKWKEFWHCDPKLLVIGSFLNTVSLSAYGDALVLGGNEFVSLWTRDRNMSTHSYSMYVYYAKEVDANMYAQCLEQKDI